MVARRRLPPHNVDAERALLGAMMLSPSDIEKIITLVVPADFYVPSHKLVFEAMVELWTNNRPIDSLTISEYLRRIDKLEAAGGKNDILRIAAAAPVSAHMRSYAKTVAECGALRRAIAYSGELSAAAYEENIERVDELLVASSDYVLSHLAAELDLTPPVDFDELTRDDTPPKYVQSARMLVGDRWIITGGEGGGKSTLMRQCAVQIASGIRLWSFDDCPPRRVLYFDLQERRQQAEREFIKLRRIAQRSGRLPVQNGMLVVFRRTGFDILNRGDRRWFERHIINARPDVVFIGPLYKCFKGEKTDESVADEVSIIFDHIVERYDIAIVFEAHSPHGISNDRAGWRPYGASLWLRWPDVGFGLAPRVVPKELKQPDGSPPSWWRDGRSLATWRQERDRGLRIQPRNLLYGSQTFWPWDVDPKEVL